MWGGAEGTCVAGGDASLGDVQWGRDAQGCVYQGSCVGGCTRMGRAEGVLNGGWGAHAWGFGAWGDCKCGGTLRVHAWWGEHALRGVHGWGHA